MPSRLCSPTLPMKNDVEHAYADKPPLPRVLRRWRIEVETEHEQDGEEQEGAEEEGGGETEVGLAERRDTARSLGGAVDGAGERTGTEAIDDGIGGATDEAVDSGEVLREGKDCW